MATYGSAWPQLAKWWDGMTILPNRASGLRATARKLIIGKARYQNVERITGVPWYLIACLHEREASMNWNTQLAQGDPLNRKSIHVPKGMGPYASWEDGAVAALRYDGLTGVKDWRLEKILYYAERFNGFGYRNHGIPSPYVWGGTSVQKRGKYTSDGHFDPNIMDSQPGVAGLISFMMEADPSIVPIREEGDRPAPVQVVDVPEPNGPRLSPKAKDEPKQIEPGALRKSRTMWGGAVAGLAGISGTIFGWLQEINWPLAIVILAALGVGVWMIWSGRVNVQKVLEAVARGDGEGG